MKKLGFHVSMFIIIIFLLTSCKNNELQEITNENELLINKLEESEEKLALLTNENNELINECSILKEKISLSEGQIQELKENLEFTEESYRSTSETLLNNVLFSSAFIDNEKYSDIVPYLYDGKAYIAQSLKAGSKIGNLIVKGIEATNYGIELELKGEFNYKGYVYFDDIIKESLVINGSIVDNSDIESVIFFNYNKEYNDFYYVQIGNSFVIDNEEQFYSLVGEEYGGEILNGDVFYVEASFENYYTYNKIESETLCNASAVRIDKIERVDKSILNQLH